MIAASRLRPVLRTGTSLAFAVVLSCSNVAFAEAASITPDSVNPWQHFSDCWDAMMHDSAAHQANCGPGQAMPDSNSTLATPVYGGPQTSGCSAAPVGVIRPLFKTYGVASLDDALEHPEQVAPVDGSYLIGTPDPCHHGCVSMSSPVFVPFDTASLDDSVVPSTVTDKKGAAEGVATCCPASLDKPLFSTYQTASLDDSIAPSVLDLRSTKYRLSGC